MFTRELWSWTNLRYLDRIALSPNIHFLILSENIFFFRNLEFLCYTIIEKNWILCILKQIYYDKNVINYLNFCGRIAKLLITCELCHQIDWSMLQPKKKIILYIIFESKETMIIVFFFFTVTTITIYQILVVMWIATLILAFVISLRFSFTLLVGYFFWLINTNIKLFWAIYAWHFPTYSFT